MPTETAAFKEIRETEFKKLVELCKQAGYEILQVNSNEFCYPCVSSNGTEAYALIKLSVPTGSRDDAEGYDGYAMAENYAATVAANKLKAEKAAEKQRQKELEKAKKKAQRQLARAEMKGKEVTVDSSTDELFE